MPAENLTRDEARHRAALVAVEEYRITLDLTTGPTTFRSTTQVTFTASAGASTFIDLIAPQVHEIVLNGRSIDPATAFAESRIALDDLAEHNSLTVVADGAYMNTGEGLHRFVDPVDDEVYLYSQFEVADARRVFAVFEQPDLKATFAFTVTAPAHWTVVSNSPTPEPTAAGEGVATWAFAPSPRISSYVTAVIAGPYHRETGELTSSDGRTIPLAVLCRASLSAYLDADEILDITRRGFAFFESRFAQPYPFAKYDQVFVPEFNAGAMENAGAVTFLENYVFRSKVPDATVERRAVTILHELAHMWFGDLVTMRWWDDLWLNESFAEYASTLAAAEATRWTQAWTTFSSMEKSWAYRQDQLPSTHPIVADIRDLEDVEVNFDGITYAKGASVLKQLVAWVGQDEFFAGVQAYFAKHAWGNTELRDLLVELEATSGRDLSAWSGLWLEQAGVTLLRPVVELDAHGVITHAAVHQEVPAEHPVQRPHRLVVSGYDVVDGEEGTRLARTSRIELDVDGPVTLVPGLVGMSRPDLILVNDEDLAYAKTRLDPDSFAFATSHLHEFEDSLRPDDRLERRLGHDARRRGRRPRLRRPRAVEHRQRDRLLGHPGAAASARDDARPVRRPARPGRPGRGCRRPAAGARPRRRRRQRPPAPARQGLRRACHHGGPARPARPDLERRGRARRPDDRHRPALGAAHGAGRRRLASARPRSTPTSRWTPRRPASGPRRPRGRRSRPRRPSTRPSTRRSTT